MTDIRRWECKLVDFKAVLKPSGCNFGQWVMYKDHIDDKAKAVAEKDQEIDRLKQTMKDVHQDLVLRANMFGNRHVALSSSQWIQLCEAIGQKP